VAYSNGTYNDSSRQIKDSAETLKNDVQSGVQSAAENMRETAKDVQAKAKVYADKAGEEISDATDKLAMQVRERPIQFGLIAVMAGFLAAFLLRK
jgi:ElaB/YqjD/DUF883 family membrane-anchored ribosome-binding protein